MNLLICVSKVMAKKMSIFSLEVSVRHHVSAELTCFVQMEIRNSKDNDIQRQRDKRDDMWVKELLSNEWQIVCRDL